MESSSERVTGSWQKISRADRVERWENVSRVLRAMPQHEREKHWNMGIWGEKTACGTVACAAGHCGLDPWFRERGFALNFRKSFYVADYWIESLSAAEVVTFFGKPGTDLIFLDDYPRSVDEVIGEVEEFLTKLRNGEYD